MVTVSKRDPLFHNNSYPVGSQKDEEQPDGIMAADRV